MCTFGASRVSRQVVVHTAKLANLQFSNDEIDRIVPDFDNMLQFVDSMYEFGIDSIEKSKSLLDELRVSGYFLRNDEPTAFPYMYVNHPSSYLPSESFHIFELCLTVLKSLLIY